MVSTMDDKGYTQAIENTTYIMYKISVDIMESHDPVGTEEYHAILDNHTEYQRRFTEVSEVMTVIAATYGRTNDQVAYDIDIAVLELTAKIINET